jgi:hypothetical protein
VAASFSAPEPRFPRPCSLSAAIALSGARAIEQLRLVCVELAPLSHAIHILPDPIVPAMQAETFDPDLFGKLDERLEVAVTDLVGDRPGRRTPRGRRWGRIEWGTPSGHHGWMQVDADGDGSRLTLFLSTRHGSESEHDVSVTLDAIRMLVESQI